MSKQTYIIAEIGQAHDGSLGILHSYIDSLKDTGIDAIKFQTHIAEAESSEYEPFRVNFSYVDKTRYDYWDRMGFTMEQWIEIKKHCDEVGLEFMSSPFSNAAVDLLEKIGVEKYKIGSGEVNNFLILEKIIKTGKPIILSSGMSSYQELDETVAFIKKHGNDLSILQCTTKYPTQAEDIGYNVITELKERYNVPVGLSDHSGVIYPSMAAVAIGASILEFHAVFDKRMFGPDAKSSLAIDQIKELVGGVRFIEKGMKNSIDKTDNSKFDEVKTIFGKSLAVNRDLQKGDIITFDVLEGKKPGNKGIPAKDFKFIIGKRIKNPLNKWDFITNEDIE